MLASSALNNLFLTYHLNFFITMVNLQSSYFYGGQLIFMVWNATNDVLFGWLSDTVPVMKSMHQSRLSMIRLGGGFWALAFLMVWFPWGGIGASSNNSFLTGLNFTVNLCVYDAMLTLVEVNHSALLAEISVDSRERARYNSWSSICAAIGSLTSLVGHLFWKSDPKLASFRVFALFVALGSWGCFELAARFLRHVNIDKAYDGTGKGQVVASVKRTPLNLELDQPCGIRSKTRSYFLDSAVTKPRAMHTTKECEDVDDAIGQAATHVIRKKNKRRSVADFLDFLGQLRRQANFVVFAFVASLQTFDCAFGKQFFTFFLEILVGDALPPGVHALTITASFLLPWLCAAALSHGIERYGFTLSATLQGVWAARLVLLFSATLLFLASASSSLSITASLWDLVWVRRCAALVVLLNRVMSECVCRLVPLVQSDLIDEFSFLSSGSSSSSSISGVGSGAQESKAASIVGTVNFISKPSQSLGPILGFAVLSRILPQITQKQNGVEGGIGTNAYDAAASALATFGEPTSTERGEVALLVIVLPLVCVCLQLQLWRQFTLKGRYLARVKKFLNYGIEGSAV